MSFETMVKQASKYVGRPAKYTPESLLQKFEEYVKHNEANPWKIGELVKNPKTLKAKEVHKTAIPPLTQGMFQVFAGINRKTWDNYCKLPKFIPVTELIQAVIAGHKFQGASIRVYDSNIIARDLGLVDKVDNNNTLNIEWNETKTYEKESAENIGKQTRDKKVKSK